MLNKSYISKLMKINKIKSIFSYIKRYGFVSFAFKIKRRLPLIFNKQIKTNKYIDKLVNCVVNQTNNQIQTKLNVKIDIIIPVYNAYESTKKCIESVLRNSSNCRLIIVNDCSTDSRITDYLQKLSSNTQNNIQIKLIHNDINLGFVHSVNKAYRYTKNHFAILNSDTEVPENWLYRLMTPIIQKEKNIASVTPFSNSADLCSFPEFCKHQAIFKNLKLSTIDHYFNTYSQKTTIEIPTGNGFCMGINRFVAEKVGLFSEELFGRGYAEEYEWSERAVRHGYKNVLAPNLFVYHKHRASFKNRAIKQIDDNFKTLRKIYPKFLVKLDEFIENDPLKDIRLILSILIDSLTRKTRLITIFETKPKNNLFKAMRKLDDNIHILTIENIDLKYYNIKYFTKDRIYEFYISIKNQSILFKFVSLLKPNFIIFR